MRCNLLLWWKADFFEALLQFSESQDPSEIILICWIIDAQETFLIINVENMKCFLIYFPQDFSNIKYQITFVNM